MPTVAGTLLLPGGPVRGVIEFEETILSVEASERLDAVPVDDLPTPIVAPGFIDTHVHGGAGGDTMDGADGVARLAAFHLGRGTTTLLPTTMTNPFDAVLAALSGVAEVVRDQAERAAGGGRQVLPSIPGAHLEGPFISPDRLGAQPACTIVPTREAVAAVLASGVVRVVTLAPEVEHARVAAAAFARAGARVSVGHTAADHATVASFATAVRAAGGVLGFTHLYNAMPGLGSRDPGVVGTALADPDAYAEVILDLHHVHPVSFRAAAAAKQGRLHLITDAIRAAGAGDGVSELGGQRVTVSGGTVRLVDGTLAGSVLTLDVALRNAVAAGIPLGAAAGMLSAVPAAYLGLADRGSLRQGARADLVVLGKGLVVEGVYVAGSSVAD